MIVNLFLYAGEQSSISQVLIALLMITALIGAVVLLFWQWHNGVELKNELEQLGKIQKHNVEFEFVLKAMRLSTWQIDPATMAVTYDNDFRDRGNEWIPLADGIKLDESNKLLHEQDTPRVAKALEDICQGRTSEYHEQYRVMLPHSKKFYWEESYATVAERDVDGRPKVIVGTSMRIDDRKKMEDELVLARNRAEESDRLKTAFIANMSHEIRTPLNAIIGFTDILPVIPEGEERQQLMDLIHENTQKLLRIIDDVVNISKVEAGKDEMVLSAFDLNGVLREQINKYEPKLKPGVKLTTSFASEQQDIVTDRNRVADVVDHLLSNAVKFTDAGSVEVGYEQPADGRLRLWVRDTGKGIAPEHQERIFERFFKVDEFIPGAGLGLSMCRTMAFSMGATVTCESALGEGSTFWFEFPVS